MKVLFVTDRPYPQAVNGIAVYLHFLSEVLHRQGVEVHFFCQGRQATRRTPELQCCRRKWATYHMFGPSPVRHHNAITAPLSGLFETLTERAFQSVLEQSRPDIVHFHEFIRTPVSLLFQSRRRGLPTLISLHDYWLLCPRLILWRPDGTVCPGMGGGRNCVVHCLGSSTAVRIYRHLLNTRLPPVLKDGLFIFRDLYKTWRGESLRQFSAGEPARPTQGNLSRRENIHHLALRQEFMIGAANSADRVLAVSEAVRHIFLRHGLHGERIWTLPLGTVAADLVRWRQRRLLRPPLRLGFMGHLGPCKGIDVLLDAIRGIPEDLVSLYVFGGGDRHEVARMEAISSQGRNIHYCGRYEYGALNRVTDCFDLLVVPSRWQEPLGMIGPEAMAAGIPVLGAAIGGIPEYIRDGVNGRLFRAGDAPHLRRLVVEIIEQPHRLAAMSAGTRPGTVSMDQHAEALLHHYREVLALRGLSAEAGGAGPPSIGDPPGWSTTAS